VNPRIAELVRGPAGLLAIAVVCAAVLGFGGYQASHLVGWGAPQSPPQPLRIHIDDATLRRVDVADSRVELSSDLLGMFGATLVVTPSTEIRVDDKPAQLEDLPEGARVRAAYVWRDGFKIASLIAVERAPVMC
jgi:hypothetical protein